MSENRKKDWTRTRIYRELRNAMLADLKNAGLDQPPYVDQVNEYMAAWCLLRELDADIEARGIRVEYRNGSQHGMKGNESIGSKIRLRGRMDEIFRNLGYAEKARKARAAAAEAQTAAESEINDDL